MSDWNVSKTIQVNITSEIILNMLALYMYCPEYFIFTVIFKELWLFWDGIRLEKYKEK